MALPLSSRYPCDPRLPPCKVSDHVLDELGAAVLAGDLDVFGELLSGPQTDINELSPVLDEALARDNVSAVSELLRRGKAVHPLNLEVAISVRAKKSLTLLLDGGWDLNAVGANHLPSVFRHVLGT
jgi:hypothetical protein